MEFNIAQLVFARSFEFRHALAEAVRESSLIADFDEDQLLQVFSKAIARRFGEWAELPEGVVRGQR